MSAARFDVAARRRVLAGLFGACFCLAAADGADAAQERRSPSGWLGVRIIQGYECEWETADDVKSCDMVMDIAEVQDGAPAEASGIQPGDRMVAVDGQDITYANWGALLGSIQPGRPVTIDFLRDGNRHFARMVPVLRPDDTESGRWVGRHAERVVVRERPRAFVVALTELPRREGGAAFAITIRDTRDQNVAVEPAALRVLDGKLRLTPLSEDVFVELPALRRQLVGDLRGITDSSYRAANSALEVVANVRSRIASNETFLRQLERVVQVELDEIDLARDLRRSFAGAEFEVAGPGLASAVEARREGILVLRVAAGTPAARLGLEPGDVLFEADGRSVRHVRDLQRALAEAGHAIEVKWMRKGTELRGMFPR